MDRTEEDMKNVGFFGIFKHSFKTIFSWIKIFTQITLTFILPLTIIFVLHMELSHHFFWRIENNSLPYETNDDREATGLEWFYYLLFEIAYFILLTVFSLLATSVIVFTIASIYTNKEVVFRNVFKVIPNIWKRVFVTFAYIYLVFIIYNVIVSVVVGILRAIFGNFLSSLVGSIIILIILIIFLVVFLYLTFVCQLASVVTILENIQGFKAIKKGKVLANGKKNVGMMISFILYLFLVGLIAVYFLFVVYGHELFKWALVYRVLMGILCGFLLLMLFLVMIVTQTFLYLVCKSYHREGIDKLSLSTFLGAYNGETMMSPKHDEVQLGRPQSQLDPSQQV